jgi:DNA adenine methylase
MPKMTDCLSRAPAKPNAKKLTPPLKWHGGKHDLAAWIISLMPPRCNKPNAPTPLDRGWLHYVEPYFGGGSVLLALDPDGISEVVNDINADLTNFWRVLQNPADFEPLRRLVEAIPFSKVEWEESDEVQRPGFTGRVQAAANFFVRCRQSLAGRMKGFTGITKTRTRRRMNNEVSAWLTAIEGLPEVHERLKRVLILNEDALGVIRKQDGPRTLFYLDPPYLHETRATTGEYDHEMTTEQHRELLTLLNDIEGRFLLSGYHSALYDEWADQNNFNCQEFKIHNHAAGGKTKRVMTECVWTNF